MVPASQRVRVVPALPASSVAHDSPPPQHLADMLLIREQPLHRRRFGGNYDDRSEQAVHPPDHGQFRTRSGRPSGRLMTGVRDYETGELKHNVVALAEAAKVLRIPTVVTTTARDSMWGPTFPELVEVVGGEHIIDRSSVNAWDDPKVAAAIEATGRKKLIF